MGLKHKRYRDMKATDIVLEFARIIPNAHINKARDASFIKRTMENLAADAIDVLWAISLYSDGSGARDVPSFCRWLMRNDDLFDGDRLAREGLLAERLTGQRLPITALPYYDLLYETIPDARLEQSWRSAQGALRSYVTTVLGPA